MDSETTAKTEPAKEALPPMARFVSTEGRERFVPLQFPVEYDGQVWDQVRVRRISAGELRNYITALAGSETYAMPPMVDCPLAVWEAMDADDQAEVDDAAMVFTPRRLKAAAERFQPSSTTTLG